MIKTRIVRIFVLEELKITVVFKVFNYVILHSIFDFVFKKCVTSSTATSGENNYIFLTIFFTICQFSDSLSCNEGFSPLWFGLVSFSRLIIEFITFNYIFYIFWYHAVNIFITFVTKIFRRAHMNIFLKFSGCLVLFALFLVDTAMSVGFIVTIVLLYRCWFLLCIWPWKECRISY